MRYRVTYNLHTSAWHQYGLRLSVNADNPDQARAIAERDLYGRKDAILAARHDYSGEGFEVEITEVCS